MIHIGVDIAKNRHKVAAIDDGGQVVWKPFTLEQTCEAFEVLDLKLRNLGPLEVQIGMEATGHYWLLLHAFLIEKGWVCKVFNPVLSKQTPAAKLRGRKTDADDALGIALTIREGGFTPYTPPDPEKQELLVLCRQREFHTKELRNAKKRLGGLMDRTFPEFRDIFSDPYGKSALAFISMYQEPAVIAHSTPGKLAKPMIPMLGKTRAREKALVIREAARGSLARQLGDAGRAKAVKLMVQHILAIESVVAVCEELIKEAYEATGYLGATITGIGKVTGPVILAEFARFNAGSKSKRKTVRAMLAFAGMEPRKRESGEFKGKDKMSKRGSRTLRTALFRAASMARLHSPVFAAVYDRQMSRGKHHYVAVSHVARKLVEVLVAVERSGQPFDPERLSKT